MRIIKRYLLLLIVALLGFSSHAAAQLTSPSYRVDETFFGTGGDVGASSTNYGVRQSSGGGFGSADLSGNNYDSATGFPTPQQIFLEVSVTGADVGFGFLDANTTSYGASQGGACNCSFYVRSYVSSGYVVITGSQPPTTARGDSLDSKTILGIPSTSTNVEEFGINLVDNSSPDIGANPVNDPDNTFADGVIASGYNTPNQFKYVPGDIIASSPGTAGNRGVGKTNYTISYIAKPKDTTPAGDYIMQHDIIVAATF